MTEIRDSEMSNTREQLAAYAHNAWAGWMQYLFGKCQPTGGDGSVAIPAACVDRWERQMQTPYAELPETEKESDRKEAEKILGIVFDQ